MTDSLEAMAFNTKSSVNDIYSCSWGPDDNGRTVDGPHHLAQVRNCSWYNYLRRLISWIAYLSVCQCFWSGAPRKAVEWVHAGQETLTLRTRSTTCSISCIRAGQHPLNYPQVQYSGQKSLFFPQPKFPKCLIPPPFSRAFPVDGAAGSFQNVCCSQDATRIGASAKLLTFWIHFCTKFPKI